MYKGDTNYFDNNYDIFRLYRIQGYNLNKKLIYSKTTIGITYSNETIFKFKRNESNSAEDITDHGDGIYSFSTEAIMYMDNDKPTVILTKNINKHKKDAKLTTTLEKLISEGYFEFLEYSYDYMLKYDKDFIKPYLKQYSCENYDRNLNENINEEFIINFSKHSLSNDF